MARTLIDLPATAKRGTVIEIKATIGHPMETGYRAGESGQILPRNILRKFTCRYNGEVVFSADLFAAVAANPHLAFHTVATESGTLALTWEGDNGFSQTENVKLTVTA